ESKLIRAEQNRILRELAQLVSQLGTPKQHRRLELTAAVLHGRNHVLRGGEPKRPCNRLPPKRQRRTVTGRAAERRAIERRPERRQTVGGIEQALGECQRPERRGRGHRSTLM